MKLEATVTGMVKTDHDADEDVADVVADEDVTEQLEKIPIPQHRIHWNPNQHSMMTTRTITK